MGEIISEQAAGALLGLAGGGAVMRGAKQAVREIADQPPEPCLGEDVQYRLYHFEILRPRTERATEGEYIEQAELEQRLAEWLQK
jgi:hypothetical protein